MAGQEEKQETPKGSGKSWTLQAQSPIRKKRKTEGAEGLWHVAWILT